MPDAKAASEPTPTIEPVVETKAPEAAPVAAPAPAAIEAAPAPVETAAAVVEVTVEEFCTDLSRTDRRVELISGFHHDERSLGHHKDTAAAFTARFAAFCDRPVS